MERGAGLSAIAELLVTLSVGRLSSVASYMYMSQRQAVTLTTLEQRNVRRAVRFVDSLRNVLKSRPRLQVSRGRPGVHIYLAVLLIDAAATFSSQK